MVMESVSALQRLPRSLQSLGTPNHLRLSLIALLALALLRSCFPAVDLHEWTSKRSEFADTPSSEDGHLVQQVRVQQDMQLAIHRNQYPKDCNNARILLRGGGIKLAKDGYASEIQYVARLLQMGMATHRALVLTPEWRSAYEPPDCSSRALLYDNATQSSEQTGWLCLWKPLTGCTAPKASKGDESSVVASLDDLDFPAAHGIVPDKGKSKYFDTSLYGPLRYVWAPNAFTGRPTELADVLSHWERAHGRFWVRSQMAHYLWRPSDWLQQEMDARSPRELVSSTAEPFIGFHIRKTDNILDFQKAFARNATATRTFDRFMAFADKIRKDFPGKNIRTIYLATDNSAVIAESRHIKWQRAGWKFVFQADVQRSTQQDRMWFRGGRSSAAAAIGTDLQILRRADFLVGSFQSNVFRLAAELNTAWHAANYSWSLHRHWTVDIEWYEDP